MKIDGTNSRLLSTPPWNEAFDHFQHFPHQSRLVFLMVPPRPWKFRFLRAEINAYLCTVCLPQGLDISLDDDVDERLEQVEDQPDVDHLDIRSRRQALRHAEEGDEK